MGWAIGSVSGSASRVTTWRAFSSLFHVAWRDRLISRTRTSPSKGRVTNAMSHGIKGIPARNEILSDAKVAANNAILTDHLVFVNVGNSSSRVQLSCTVAGLDGVLIAELMWTTNITIDEIMNANSQSPGLAASSTSVRAKWCTLVVCKCTSLSSRNTFKGWGEAGVVEAKCNGATKSLGGLRAEGNGGNSDAPAKPITRAGGAGFVSMLDTGTVKSPEIDASKTTSEGLAVDTWAIYTLVIKHVAGQFSNYRWFSH